MNEQTTSASDIVDSINKVLEHLKRDGQGRQALGFANQLLTNVMALLRPIRIKEQHPGGPKSYTNAERRSLPVKKLRRLKASVFRGVMEIEDGDFLLATTTFTDAREAWQADRQKPIPNAKG